MSAAGRGLDPFTRKRLARFIEEHRQASGQLPTLQDFARAGFGESVVDGALKERIIEKFYVTLTNGTVVKGYKLK